MRHIGLFTLHLIIADQDIQRTSTEIVESLPYKLCTVILDSYFEPFFPNPDDRPTQFPHSVHLKPTIATLIRDDYHPSSVATVSRRSREEPLSVPFSVFEHHSVPNENYIHWLDDWDLLGRVHTKMKGILSGWCHIFFFTLCGIIHEYSQMAITNQTMRKCYRIFGQKISCTLSSSHTVELLAWAGSCLQRPVRMCWRNLGALSSIPLFFYLMANPPH